MVIYLFCSSLNFTFYKFWKVAVSRKWILHINELAVGTIMYNLLKIYLLFRWIKYIRRTTDSIKFYFRINIWIHLWCLWYWITRCLFLFNYTWVLNSKSTFLRNYGCYAFLIIYNVIVIIVFIYFQVQYFGF